MSAAPAAAGTVEQVTYDNRIVTAFMIASVVFGIVGLLVGVLIAVQLALPALNLDLPFLSYGRLRPLHTNAIIFAFTGNAIFAGVYYSLQRLCKARLFDDRLSWLHFWGWQLIIASAAITLPLGFTTGKEYAELEWPIDIAIALIWVAFGVNMIGTILKRREPHLYVAIWFYLATWLGITLLHVVNSLAVPAGPLKSYSVYAGIQDALVQWWYGHNAVAFFLTTPLLGLMYYFLPKAAERPVYSYRLSIIHFWALIFIYIWAGPHHLLNSAMPEWAQTLGVVFSIVLLAPSWGGMINGLLTLRGAWDKVRTSPVLKFFVAAITFYGMSTFEGPLLSLREVNALSHNTDWTIGHVHSGALGWVGLLMCGVFYWLAPRLWKTRLYSDTAANFHFWIATTAIALYAVVMWISGIAQGAMQLWFDDNGQLSVRTFQQIVEISIPFYWFRAFGGLLYLAGFLVMAWNLWMTFRTGTRTQDETVTVALVEVDAPAEPLIEEALKTPGARAKATAIHGLIERWPVVLMVLAMVGLLIGSVLSVVPSLIQGAMSPRIASVTPYTPLELLGRDIYTREGCSTCHTQMVRTLRAEVARYGDYTRPGEGIYDRPFLWGSKRTGPDLAREGLLNPSTVWHYDHTLRPADIAPWTVMPAYPWLGTDTWDPAVIPPRMSALSVSPIRTYTPREIERGPELALAQARMIADELRATGRPELIGDADLERREIIALIAYLKRLGTDLTARPGTTGIAGLEARILAAPAATAAAGAP